MCLYQRFSYHSAGLQYVLVIKDLNYDISGLIELSRC